MSEGASSDIVQLQPRRLKARRPGPVLIAEAPPMAEALDQARPRAWRWAPLMVVGMTLGVWAVIVGLIAFVVGR